MDFFPRDAAIRRIGREVCLLAGGPAAVVLQAAHPVVAAGVAAFSRFREAPYQRLFHTLNTVYAIVFGTQSEVERISAAMIDRHRRIAGPGFSGLDPDAQYWVLATLIKAAIENYERVYGRLADPVRETYYKDMLVFGRCFGLDPAGYPQHWPDFVAYYQAMLAGPRLGSGDHCHEVIHAIVYPRAPWYLRIAMPWTRFLIVEQIPAELRHRLGLRSTRWTRIQWAFFQRIIGLIRFMPRRLRWVPAHFKAEKRTRKASKGSPFVESP